MELITGGITETFCFHAECLKEEADAFLRILGQFSSTPDFQEIFDMGAPISREWKVATSARTAPALETALQGLETAGPPELRPQVLTVFDDGTNFNIVYMELTYS